MSVGSLQIGDPVRTQQPQPARTANIDMSDSESKASHTATSSSINAVSVKLPQFSTQETVTWFRRAEIQFRLRKITDPRTKADYVLESGPDSVFVQIAAWLDQQQDEVLYDDLRKYLLEEFTLSPSARAQKLLSFPQQSLGDRTAHSIWNEMQSLARLPEKDPTTGNYKQVDLMRELWLQTLPSPVRAALHDSTSLEMSVLVKKADDLLNAAKAAQSQNLQSGITSAEPGAVYAIERTAAAPGQQTRQQMQDRQNRRRSGTTFRAVILESGICSYHSRFGDKARNYIPGCK